MIDIQKRQEVLMMVKHLARYFEKTKNSLCEPYGLSAVQSTLLLDIYHYPGSKVTDVCYRLNKSTNTISPLINRLVAQGYLTKEVGQDDGRVVRIWLTDKSKGVMSSLMEDIEKYTWPLFDSVSDEEFDKIYSSLKRFLEITD